MLRAFVAVIVAATGLFVSAAPAAAHASLESTDPVSGTALDRAPGQVLLTFTEKVEASLGGIRLFDGDGEPVPLGGISHPEGQPEVVAVDLPDLDRGAYVVTWRVVSSDSHPVRGALTFRVGPAPADDDSATLARRLLAAEGGSPAVGAFYAVARFAAFAALVLLVGGVAFLGIFWAEGTADGRARRMLWGAFAGLAVATAAGIGLQGAYAGGLTLADAVRPSVVRAVLDTRFGQVWAARLALLVLVAPFLAVVLRGGAQGSLRGVLRVAGAVLGVGLLLTPGVAGHAASGEHVALAVVTDLVHLAAVSLWLGGLAFLAMGVLFRAPGPVLARVVPRFSAAAFWSVLVILASGVVQSWRQVGSLDALTETTYGQVLLVKVALFGGMVVLGALSRSAVQRRYRVPAPLLSPGPGAQAADADADTARRLRRSVGAEVLLAVAVLAAASLLVNTPPARSALSQPFATEVTAGEVSVDVTVDPARAGRTDLHLYTLTPDGAVREVEDLTASFRLPERDVGPLKVPLERAGPGHFSAYGFELPLAGAWELDLIVRLNEVDQVRGAATVPVR